MIIIYLEKDIRSQHGHVPRHKYVFDLFFCFFLITLIGHLIIQLFHSLFNSDDFSSNLKILMSFQNDFIYVALLLGTVGKRIKN